MRTHQHTETAAWVVGQTASPQVWWSKGRRDWKEKLRRGSADP